MVTINIEKRHLYLLTAVMVFLVGAGLVVSSVDWDNPAVWHDAEDVKIPGNMKLSGIFDDTGKVKCSEIVNDESADDICNDAVGGESLNCEIKTCANLNTAQACTVSCSEGYMMTGVTGRVTWDTEGAPNFKGAYPPNLENGNTWTCQFGEHTGSATCYLRCCKIF